MKLIGVMVALGFIPNNLSVEPEVSLQTTAPSNSIIRPEVSWSLITPEISFPWKKTPVEDC